MGTEEGRAKFWKVKGQQVRGARRKRTFRLVACQRKGNRRNREVTKRESSKGKTCGFAYL